MEAHSFDVVVIAVGLAAAAAGALRLRALPPTAPPTGSIGVVIPARNEAARLPHLLAALASDRSLTETGAAVLVVDDGSTDGTGELAASMGAGILSLSGPPAGWTGKSWACWNGAGALEADLLVFLDADTVPDPGFVLDLASTAERSDGLASVQPIHRTTRAYEVLSAPCNVAAVLGCGTGPVGGRRWLRRPMAFGPALAIPAARYRQVGGHAAVRAEIVEDLALARECHEAGIAVSTWVGGGISYRMYPEGLRSLLQGWTKNLAVGASAAPPARTALVFAWVTATLMLAPLPFQGAIGIAAYVVAAAVSTALLRAVGRFPWWAGFAAPALAGGFVVLVVWSAARRALGRPSTWRGRVVASR